MVIPKPITKEGLASLKGFPELHKKAIESAIGQYMGDDPEDKIWPDYFRGEMVECQSAMVISEDDKLGDGEYETEAVWFLSGWMALVNRGK